uniref:Para-hydroxybenzoate--polyprenyltransferase, mitochondrial n=1 Tax=Aegilops tauschii TaxID=37682 RepID=M8BFI5_AEGTA
MDRILLPASFSHPLSTSSRSTDQGKEKEQEPPPPVSVSWVERWRPYAMLARLDKPIGTWLLGWPSMWSITMAAIPGELPDLRMLALFGCGAVLLRGAGCTVNDLLDRDIDNKITLPTLRVKEKCLSGCCSREYRKRSTTVLDKLDVGRTLRFECSLLEYYLSGSCNEVMMVSSGDRMEFTDLFLVQVERTKSRPFASGALTPSQGVCFLGSQLLLGLGILLQLNDFSRVLGASSLLLVFSYPLMKRFTFWPQAFLGLTFNWGALLGWAAIKGSLDPAVIIPLYTAGQEDDLKVGVKSTALRFGDSTKQWISAFGAASIGSFALSGYNAELAWPYYPLLTAAAAQLAWQISTVDLSDRADCNRKYVSLHRDHGDLKQMLQTVHQFSVNSCVASVKLLLGNNNRRELLIS